MFVLQREGRKRIKAIPRRIEKAIPRRIEKELKPFHAGLKKWLTTIFWGGIWKTFNL
jgi:hypothetical protein